MLRRLVSVQVAHLENDEEQAGGKLAEYGLLIALIVVVAVSLITLGSFMAGA